MEKLSKGGFSDLNFDLNQELLSSLAGDKTKEDLEKDDNLYNNEFNLEEGYDITEAPFFGFDSNHQTLFIKMVPKECARRDLEKIFEGMEGFICLSLSEPLRTQDFVRFGWVIFDSDANCAKAIEGMDKDAVAKFDLSIVKNKQQRRFVRMLKGMTKNRVDQHYELSKELIKNLDLEKGIKGNKLLEEMEGDKRHLLDLNILYLRKVHFYCYYSTAVREGKFK